MSRVRRFIAIVHALHVQYRAYRRYQAGREPTAPRRFVDALIELGPTFVKLGQILSTRPDVLPQAYVDALVRLQDDQPPEPLEVVRSTLERELAAPVDARFAEFDRHPVASASLAQVHRARLAESGLPVAVKVQRPELATRMAADLDTFALALQWAERLVPARIERTNAADFLREFRRYTLQELDFAHEGAIVERFRSTLSNLPQVRVPTIHWDRTTAQVLTMEWVEGMRLAEAADRLAPAERRRLAEAVVEALLQMFVSDGLFHADLHPGNIVFHADGSFTLLDFGLYGELTAAQRDRFVLYLMAVVQRQIRRAFHHFKAQTRRLPGADERRFFERFAQLAETFYASPLRDMSFARVYLEMMKAGYAYGFVFPSELMLHAKALTTAETLLFTLDPELRFEQIARPIIAREVAARAASPDRIRDRLTQFVPELLLLGEVLPPEAVDDVWDRRATDDATDLMWRAALKGVRGRLERGGLWNALLERHARAAFAGTAWADDVDELLEEAWERYYDLEPDLPVERAAGATFTTHLAVATLAIYRSLRARGAEKHEAYRLIYDAGWNLYTRMGEPPLLLASAITRDPGKRLRIATDLFRAFPFGEPGYIWQDVDDAPTTVGFDCLRCPVAEFFARHEEAELCVQTWCNLDFPLAEQWGGRLERASTIAAGADRCDFRWRVGRGPEP